MAAMVTCAIAVPAYIYIASEAVIERRYPLPAIAEPTEPSASMLIRGAHLVRVTGCRDCHGTDLEGRRMNLGMQRALWSSNLRIAAWELSDGEFERALRHGLATDATSLWEMPSADYLYMSESDVEAIFAYLRSLGPAGPRQPRPRWGLRERFLLIDDRIIPSVLAARDASSSLDLGPRYDGGRYLARIACSECHGADLTGAAGAPDLDITSRYDKPEFFNLLRRGIGAQDHRVPVMKRLASVRFRALEDYEIFALLDYLEARAHAPADLIAQAKANEKRRRAQSAAENQD